MENVLVIWHASVWSAKIHAQDHVASMQSAELSATLQTAFVYLDFQATHSDSVLFLNVSIDIQYCMCQFNMICKYVHYAFQYSHAIIRRASVVSGITVW